jgi:hypothetical protein
MTKQPQERDPDYARYEGRSPIRPIVTWINEELRDRIQRNADALAEIHLARDAQRPAREPDPRQADREAEP